MPGYVSYPIESNPSVLLTQAYNYIKSRAPVWQEHDGNLDVWILQALATMASDLRVLATDVPDRIFRYYGDTILGVHPQAATSAQVRTTWTAIDLNGHLIPAGTHVGIRDGAGRIQDFQTVNDITIIPGLSETGEGEVVLIAVEPGSAASNLGVTGDTAELIDSRDFVDTVTLFETTAGGVDAETVDEYTDRLVEFMQNLSTRPVLPDDFARAARGFPGVFRAVAIDGYNPDNDSFGNERMITVVGVDQFGLDLPDQVKDDLDDYLQAQREINFIVNVMDPARTIINVDFTGKSLPGFNAAEVEATAEAAITSYLSPMNWGLDPTIASGSAAKTWVETVVARYNKVMQVLENVEGMAYIDFLTINRSTDAPGMTDVTLDQPAALTGPGTISGSVS